AGRRNYGLVRDTLNDDPRNGWKTDAKKHDLATRVAVFALEKPVTIEQGDQLVFVLLHRSTQGDSNIGRFRISVTDQPGRAVRRIDRMPLARLAEAVKVNAEFNSKVRDDLLFQFLEDREVYQRARREYSLAKSQLTQVRRSSGKMNVMVMKERSSPRKTHVLVRGVWDKKGDEVTHSVPKAVLPWPSEKTKSRMDLARWLVSRENPLTARVLVNQLWQILFGAGLVRTPEDFGLQGEFPTHPDLLDWLAVELMDSSWNLRHILKTIVLSKTYRQSSELTPALLERDPANRRLARSSRYRLPSFMIRDAALRSSGLLNPAVGGPPVMPYQPAGVWQEMFMGRFTYRPSQGAAQHRRTLYAFWRRTAAPTFLFDSSQRRVCEVRLRKTNTPLHALTLLNDENLLEASRELARTVIASQRSPGRRLDELFRRVLSREPSVQELSVLSRELARATAHYEENPDDAMSLLDFGQPEKRGNRSAELAAYLVVSSMVYNLDEAMTRE
ncbi:MAG: DUF1553 domain-containing protein, partial [Planctomycetota bacterium]